jgi:hypothetical protein
MIQRSKISRQLVAILLFGGNVTILLPFGASYPQDKVALPANMPKTSKKRCTVSALACSRKSWPTKPTNDTKW